MLDRDDLSHLAIPDFLLRDDNNQLVNKRMSESVETGTETAPPKAKANGAAKPAPKAAAKAAGKPKAKAAAKAPAKKAAPKAAKKAAKAAPAKAPRKAPAEKDEFGLSKGSAKSQAAAMYARKNGATLAEVKEKVGSIQLNVLNALEEAGHTVEREKVERKGERPVTRYRLIAKK